MPSIRDERGVSEVLGTILVFGLLIALLSILQTQAVPAANHEIEVQHQQSIHDDFAALDEAMSRVTTTGEPESTTLSAGTSYPRRMLFFNPPDPAGRLSTSDERTVRVENVRATDPNVRAAVDGTLALDARTLRYSPGYNYHGDAPTIAYEYGLLYDDYGDRTHVRSDGSVVDGTDVDLRLLAGEYDRASAGALPLEVRPNSAPGRAVSVTGTGPELVLSLPTNRSVAAWDAAVGDEAAVERVEADGDRVDVVLDGSRTYTLRTSRIALSSGAESPDPHYLVPVDGNATTVADGGAATAGFEVRDEYNNPVSGADVEIDLPGSGSATVPTDADGQATITHQPSGSTTITGTIAGCSAPRCSAEKAVAVGGGGFADINPASPAALVEAEMDGNLVQDIGDALLGWLVDFGSASDAATQLTFDASETRTVESLRVSYYYPSGDDAMPKGGTVSDADGTQANFTVGGGFVDTGGLEIEPGSDDPSLVFAFVKDATGLTGLFTDTEPRTIDEGDFVVVTFEYASGERATYFAAPRT